MRQRDEATPKPKKPTLAEQYAAQVAARGGYKPLTGKSTGEYLQPDTNMYNAGPMDVLRGINNMVGQVGDFLVVEPAKSLGRTLSTRNIQTVFNPKSSLTERANALTEDVLNVASLVPTFKGAAAAADAASMARYYKTNFTPPRAANTVLSNRASLARDKAMRAQENLDLLTSQSKIRPEHALMDVDPSSSSAYLRPEWAVRPEPGLTRFWHTNQKGEKLPYPLKSMRDAARIPERRGSGATQLLSGGLYGTNHGLISSRYLSHFDDPSVFQFPGSVLPEKMIDDWMAVPAVHEQNFAPFPDIDPQVARHIRQMQIDDYKGQMINLDDPANILPLYRDSSFSDSDKTVRQILEEANDAEYARYIIDQAERPIVYKPTGLKPERITFKHPIVRNQDGTYSRSAIVSPGTNLYLFGEQARNARLPFSQNYYERLAAEEKAFIAREIDKLKRAGASPKEIFDIQVQLEYRNPYSEFRSNTARPTFTTERHLFPGQNYWDLPVLRNEKGTIESIGGLKAIDIDSEDPEVFENLSKEISRFVNQRFPEKAQTREVQEIIKQIADLARPNAQRTMEFSRLQGELDRLLMPDLIDRNVTRPKEEMYQFLADEGYGIIPHTGGQVTKGPKHLSINILKPEFLPASGYIPDKRQEINNLISELASLRARQIRSMNSTMTAAPYNDAILRAAIDKARKGALSSGARLAASSNFQRIGGL